MTVKDELIEGLRERFDCNAYNMKENDTRIDGWKKKIRSTREASEVMSLENREIALLVKLLTNE